MWAGLQVLPASLASPAQANFMLYTLGGKLDPKLSTLSCCISPRQITEPLRYEPYHAASNQDRLFHTPLQANFMLYILGGSEAYTGRQALLRTVAVGPHGVLLADLRFIICAAQ